MNLAEEATCRQPDRSAVSTEAGKGSVGKQSNQTVFCRLTPELSRAERGGWEPVLLACPEVSTKPRHGVGLNDLLGGKEASGAELRTSWPKTEAKQLERAPQTYGRPSPKRRIRRSKTRR